MSFIRDTARRSRSGSLSSLLHWYADVLFASIPSAWKVQLPVRALEVAAQYNVAVSGSSGTSLYHPSGMTGRARGGTEGDGETDGDGDSAAAVGLGGEDAWFVVKPGSPR